MKSSTLKLACALGALFVAGNANAAANAMTISGASFDDQFGGPCAARENFGLANSCGSDTNFIYGIPKGPSTIGYTITYTGSHTNTSVTTTFAVFSYTPGGSLLSFKQASTSGVLNWSTNIVLTAAQAPASSRLTSYVGIPAAFQGSF